MFRALIMSVSHGRLKNLLLIKKTLPNIQKKNGTGSQNLTELHLTTGNALNLVVSTMTKTP